MNPKNGGGEGGEEPQIWDPPPSKNWGPPQRGNIPPLPPQFLQPFNNPPKKGGDLKLGTPPPHLHPNPPYWDPMGLGTPPPNWDPPNWDHLKLGSYGTGIPKLGP